MLIFGATKWGKMTQNDQKPCQHSIKGTTYSMSVIFGIVVQTNVFRLIFHLLKILFFLVEFGVKGLKGSKMRGFLLSEERLCGFFSNFVA